MKIVLAASVLSLLDGAITLAQLPGTFTATGNMITPRYSHTATSPLAQISARLSTFFPRPTSRLRQSRSSM